MGRLLEAMSAAGRRDLVWPLDPVFLPYFSADARARMAAGQPASHADVDEAMRQPGFREAVDAKMARLAPPRLAPPRSGATDISHDELAAFVGREAGVVLEVGCNDGTDTVELLARYPKATVYCFECDPRPIAKWKARVTDPRATLYPIALDETPGAKTFHQSGGSPPGQSHPDGWDMSGSLCAPTGHLTYSPWCRFDTKIAVDTMTLDEWAATTIPEGLVDLAWLDTQGAEMRIFRGGRATLARTRWLKCECHRTRMYDGAPSESEIMDFLGAAWGCIGRFADDLLFENRNLRA